MARCAARGLARAEARPGTGRGSGCRQPSAAVRITRVAGHSPAQAIRAFVPSAPSRPLPKPVPGRARARRCAALAAQQPARARARSRRRTYPDAPPPPPHPPQRPRPNSAGPCMRIPVSVILPLLACVGVACQQQPTWGELQVRGRAVLAADIGDPGILLARALRGGVCRSVVIRLDPAARKRIDVAGLETHASRELARLMPKTVSEQQVSAAVEANEECFVLRLSRGRGRCQHRWEARAGGQCRSPLQASGPAARAGRGRLRRCGGVRDAVDALPEHCLPGRRSRDQRRPRRDR